MAFQTSQRGRLESSLSEITRNLSLRHKALPALGSHLKQEDLLSVRAGNCTQDKNKCIDLGMKPYYVYMFEESNEKLLLVLFLKEKADWMV